MSARRPSTRAFALVRWSFGHRRPRDAGTLTTAPDQLRPPAGLTHQCCGPPAIVDWNLPKNIETCRSWPIRGAQNDRSRRWNNGRGHATTKYGIDRVCPQRPQGFSSPRTLMAQQGAFRCCHQCDERARKPSFLNNISERFSQGLAESYRSLSSAKSQVRA